MRSRKSLLVIALLPLYAFVHGCGGSTLDAGDERGNCLPHGICNSGLVCLSGYCVKPSGSDAGVTVSPLVISTANRTPRTTTWSVNYWEWLSSGNGTAGTESLVAALKPALLRIGGYNNDANTPESFGNDELDTAVAYARAIGAEPILQVPLLADTSGQPATAAVAAAMVKYANVTKGYGLKYFAVGNEPDLYASQGSLVDSSAPAIPGYAPSDYCASATAYVTAMKAVDPTIQIVGPDLSYKYRPGSGTNDWLTPILSQCGDLFDIISIHRYPFEAKQATLAAAHSDTAAFRSVMTSLLRELQATGQGSKPLALTEMNIAYDATACVLDASPGTVGSALWMADTLGAAIDLGLWTSAVWDIGDTDDWSLGLLGMPPSHTPRPPYYAYALYAAHFGPTVLDVPSSPAGVSAHASRNQADDATEVIAVNWNAASEPLSFHITGLASAPEATTFVLPATSITAVEISDQGAASAWTYGEAERAAAIGPQALAAGLTPATDAGLAAGSSDGGAGRVAAASCNAQATVCPKVTLPSALITASGTSSAGELGFGSDSYHWESFTYAGAGQAIPTATLTPDGNGMEFTDAFVTPISETWEGMGLFFDGASCIDATPYTGVKFDFSGDVGACSLAFGANFSGDQSTADDPTRGNCAGDDSVCYAPMSTLNTVVTAGEGGAAGAAAQGSMTILVPFSALDGGSPDTKLDPSTLVSVQWQLNAPQSGMGCSAAFTVENVAFY
jgi:hypothetical protein